MKELISTWFAIAPWWEICLVFIVTFVLGVTFFYGVIDWFFTNYIEITEDLERACLKVEDTAERVALKTAIRNEQLKEEEAEWADRVKRHKADRIPTCWEVMRCELNGHAPWEDGFCE